MNTYKILMFTYCISNFTITSNQYTKLNLQNLFSESSANSVKHYIIFLTCTIHK